MNTSKLMRISIILFIYVGSCFISPSTPSIATILVPPQPVTVLDGDTVLFTCTAIGSTVDYLVDGVVASDASVAELGFTQGLIQEIDNSTSIQRNMTAVASGSENNNTAIVCRALTFSVFTLDKSSPVSFLVQGPLSSINDIMYTYLEDFDHVNISWSPPYTLPGIDIIGYNITITTTNSTTTTVVESFITTHHYLAYKAPCDEIMFTAIGYNGLNGTNDSSVIIPIESEDIAFTVEVGNVSSAILAVSTSINVTNVCPTHFPTNITITVQCDNEVIKDISDDVTIPLELKFLLIKKTLLLPNNECDSMKHNWSATVQLFNDQTDLNISKVVYFTLLKDISSIKTSIAFVSIIALSASTSNILGSTQSSFHDYKSLFHNQIAMPESMALISQSFILTSSNIVTRYEDDSTHVQVGVITGSVAVAVIVFIVVIIMMIGILCFIYWRKVNAQYEVEVHIQDVYEANPSYGQLPLHPRQIAMDQNQSYSQVNFALSNNPVAEHIYENSSSFL